jgi:hypothetical protein
MVSLIFANSIDPPKFSIFGYSGFPVEKNSPQRHRVAEFGEFLNQRLFTPRPPRLGGEISEPCFTGKQEETHL